MKNKSFIKKYVSLLLMFVLISGLFIIKDMDYVNATMEGEKRVDKNISSKEELNVLYLKNQGKLSQDKFEDNGGEYSINYILKNFNLFLKGDYEGTHVVGPVVTGGKFKAAFGGLTAPSPTGGYPHKTSSYIKGSAEVSGQTFNAYSDVNVYLGTLNKGKTFYLMGKDGIQNPDGLKYTDEYIDFTKWEKLKNEAIKLNENHQVEIKGTSEGVISTNSDMAKITFSEDSAFKYLITIKAGSSVMIDAEILANSIINVVSIDQDVDTIIASDGKDITLPLLMIDGKEPLSIEYEESGLSIVYSLPYASKVTNRREVTGHIVAPFAEVEITAGNYNGTIIASDVKTSAEGHMWPYNGDGLLPENPGDKDVEDPGDEDVEDPGDKDVENPEDEDVENPGDKDVEDPGDKDVENPEGEEGKDPESEDSKDPESEDGKEPESEDSEDPETPEGEDVEDPEVDEDKNPEVEDKDIETPKGDDTEDKDNSKLDGEEMEDTEVEVEGETIEIPNLDNKKEDEGIGLEEPSVTEKDDKDLEVLVENNKGEYKEPFLNNKTLPKTGDGMSSILINILMTLAGIAFIFLGIKKKIELRESK